MPPGPCGPFKYKSENRLSIWCRVESVRATNQRLLVLIGASESRDARLLQHQPADSVRISDTLYIGLYVSRVEMSQTLRRMDLRKTLVRKRKVREHDGRAPVFRGIGQTAALRDRAEALVVFAGQRHVIGIESEDGIDRGVFASPHKRLNPGIRRRQARQFDVAVRR